jgi:sialic acid synthase SpsE
MQKELKNLLEDIKKGEVLTKKNVRSIRPGDGINPKYYEDVIGRNARSDIKMGTPVKWDMID